MQGKKMIFFSGLLVHKCFVFDWDLDRGNGISSRWELKIWTSIDININSTYDFQDSDASNKISTSATKQFTKSGKHPTKTNIWGLNLYFCREVSFKIKEIQN